MAIEIIEKGTAPKFFGKCPVCGTKFFADTHDCEIEIDAHFSVMAKIFATAKCPCCGINVQMDILNDHDYQTQRNS